MDAWIGILGAVIAAVVAFVLGRVNLNRQDEVQTNEELRRTRLDSLAALCAAIVEYRRAQLHRWFVGHDVGTAEDVERQRPEVADEVRRTRATAWGQLYKVLMICDDAELERRARRAMELTKRMKQAATADELNDISDQVHHAVDELARHAGTMVRLGKQRKP